MNKDRLLILAEFLEVSVPPDQFDLRTWSNANRVVKHDRCACAIGWATEIPQFAELGLRLELNEHIQILVPVFLREKGYDAAMEFFGLNENTTMNLFSVSRYSADDSKNPKAVAAKIRQLIHGWDERRKQ